jgi:ankyrin repeat protein
LDTLLQRKPNIDAWKENGGSALRIAIQKRCAKAVWLLLEKDPYVDAVSNDGSVLFCAVTKGMKDVVKELLARGADPNRQIQHDTPFSQAIWYACTDGNGDTELADLLLEAGADVNGGNGLSCVQPDPFCLPCESC